MRMPSATAAHAPCSQNAHRDYATAMQAYDDANPPSLRARVWALWYPGTEPWHKGFFREDLQRGNHTRGLGREAAQPRARLGAGRRVTFAS